MSNSIQWRAQQGSIDRPTPCRSYQAAAAVAAVALLVSPAIPVLAGASGRGKKGVVRVRCIVSWVECNRSGKGRCQVGAYYTTSLRLRASGQWRPPAKVHGGPYRRWVRRCLCPITGRPKRCVHPGFVLLLLLLAWLNGPTISTLLLVGANLAWCSRIMTPTRERSTCAPSPGSTPDI